MVSTIATAASLLPSAIFSQFVQFAQIHQKGCVLLLPGGRSIVSFFEQWKLHMRDLPDGFYQGLHIFSVDERRVPKDHEDNNMRLFMEHCGNALVENRMLLPEHIHWYDHEQPVDVYEKEFLAQCGDGADLVLCGVGEDGHIGALPPNHAVLYEHNTLFTTLDDSPKPPSKRMTATPKLLQDAKQVWLLFTGKAKTQAYKQFMRDGSIEELPARMVADKAKVFTDIEV